MPGVGNNLYPPIINTWMPAFVRTTACRVYFSLSNYNSTEDIKNVQVIVNNQNNNLTALSSDKYPVGIKITSLNIDEDVVGNNKYYVVIYPSDLEGGVFELNQFYKVQIRFTGIGADPLPDSKKLASWLVNNQQYFSEWSTVCLVKGIQQPLLYLKGFEDTDETTETVFTSETIDFIGQMYYEENSEIEKEYLKYYQIFLYNNNSDELLYSSDIIYTEIYNPNEINYNLPLLLEDGVSYRAVIRLVTSNEYIYESPFVFTVISNAIDVLNATITAEPDINNGRIKLSIQSTTTEAYLGNITIRRTSSRSDFTLWEDLRTEVISGNQSLNLDWYDYTIESGVWYRYGVQKRNTRGDRGSLVQIREPVMIVFDDMFLTEKDFQLNVRFDPGVSSFRHTISESKTDTIGSKYPFFRRNGSINYRQFPITGLITRFCDEDEIFLSKDIIYQDSRVYFDRYNDDNNINDYQDYTYEREFRSRIIDFLYKDNVKLFRSATEGNVLVKLMDISFTPNQTLGRMLYTFNATAYEVDECSIDNYDAYNISDKGEFNPYVEFFYDKVIQFSGDYEGNQELMGILQKELQDKKTSEYVETVNYLSWVRISFESDPYLVRLREDGSMEPVFDDSYDDNCLMGYIVYINNIPIFVSRKGYFELKDEDTLVTSIYFPTPTTVTIDCIGRLEREQDVSRVASKLYFHTKAGQIFDIFDINDSVFQKIYLKYYEDYVAYYQNLVSIDKIAVEGITGTVIYIKDSFDDRYYRHVIGETGQLALYYEDAVFTGFYFRGVHLNKALTNEAEKTEYIETGKSISSTEDIPFEEIVYHGVYTVNGERKIFYDNEWYNFNELNDVECPVESTIDYIYELVKGEY